MLPELLKSVMRRGMKTRCRITLMMLVSAVAYADRLPVLDYAHYI
jgi:hypothetical protein